MISIFYNELNHPIIDVVIIFILMHGFYLVGLKLILFMKIGNIIRSVSEQKYQNIIIGLNFFTLILFTIINLFEHAEIFLLITFSLVFLIGVLNIIRKIIKIRNKKFYKKINRQSLFNFYSPLLLFFLLLISLSPVTNADSLAYHAFAGKYLIQNGTFPSSILFPHLRTIGSGEIIIGLGLVANIEQLNSFVQMIGLIGLFGIIKFFNTKKIMQILLISSPIILFFVSSIKPQLFHIASNGLIFSIIFKNYYVYKKNITNKNNIIFFIFIIITSITAKFSFILSGFIISSLILFEAYKRKYLLNTFIIICILLTIFYFPNLFWKWNQYGGNFLELIYSPFTTNLVGIDNFKSMLMNHGNEKPFYWLFFPLHYKEITQTLGAGFLLYFFLIYNYKKNTLGLVVVTFFILIGFLFGQKQPRFFFEVYFWIIFLVCLNRETISNNYFFKGLVILQSFIVFLVSFYGVVTLSQGLISNKLEQKVLKDHANGYSLYRWANSVLNENRDPVMYFHRSISLAKNKAVSSNFLYYIDPKDPESKIYFEKLRSISPKYAVLYLKSDLNKYSNCFIELVEKKENVGFHATRNPLARGNNYDGYIFKMDASLFPGCINN